MPSNTSFDVQIRATGAKSSRTVHAVVHGCVRLSKYVYSLWANSWSHEGS